MYVYIHIWHAPQDLIYHQILAVDWKGIEDSLTSLQFVEIKCRSVEPYHLLTDYRHPFSSLIFNSTSKMSTYF
jgi:hypothetical protein